MAGYFLDSSALAKLYHQEVGSAVVEELVLSATATVLISRLSVVEVQSAFAGKVRAGVIQQAMRQFFGAAFWKTSRAGSSELLRRRATITTRPGN
ncbi:MAG: type II toxin-antitoxin system VapC family toxin [Acidobacteria bacterium]|nr:type II toxin-antitoxin system VapC family toxin [Acidobacteriota bacterium]